jgi:hypothetical protein
VGSGVVQVLLVVRGFINGVEIGRLKRDHGIDTVIPISSDMNLLEGRHRQAKSFWDLTRFHSTAWSLVVNQLVFVCLTYSLLQIDLLSHGHQELTRRTQPTSRRLLPDGDRVIIYRQRCFGFFTLLEHMEMTLGLEGKARRRALDKARSFMQDVPPHAGDPGPKLDPAPGEPAPYV